MRKLLYSAIITAFVFITQLASAQSNYINHTLKQGESLSVLAKQYNTNVGDIMRMNGMHANTKLVYGSVIKIPSSKKITTTLTTKPAVQQPTAPANAITHKVIKGETLYSISKQYNISVEQLKTWNHLTDNSAKLGSVLIVSNNSNKDVAVNSLTATKRERTETTAQIQQQPASEPEKIIQVNNSTIKDTASTAATANNTSTDFSQGSTPGDVVDSNTSNKIVENNASTNVTESNASTINKNTPVNNVLVKTGNSTDGVASDNTTSFNTIKNSEGAFAEGFKKSTKQQHISGISKTFKTASGWSDGKYYILADDITPGTIVKLTADNGNAVYAKVLWNMGSLKENSGINFRISNATAAALNENADAFNLSIYY